MEIRIVPLSGIPAVHPGDDLVGFIGAAIERAGIDVREDDVLVVCQKVVSKAEGRVVRLTEVAPSERASSFAREFSKDPVVVELALREAREVLRMDRGHLITATGPGFICANSGLDRSNQNDVDEATLLPLDADRSAALLRSALGERFGVSLAVVISDTFGRPWRLGQLDVAIGAAGLAVLDDHAGRADWSGRTLEHTMIACADQLAAAAGLAAAKHEGVPACLIRGYGVRPPVPGAECAADLVRPASEDLFR
jgi:coenzyme F420-0:L-glutamate ligase / coenzyme F420-1:gamma-L-glutamate ligase